MSTSYMIKKNFLNKKFLEVQKPFFTKISNIKKKNLIKNFFFEPKKILKNFFWPRRRHWGFTKIPG